MKRNYLSVMFCFCCFILFQYKDSFGQSYSWVQLNTPNAYRASAILVGPSGTIYLVNGPTYWTENIFKTSDNGTTWIEISKPIKQADAACINSQGHLFISNYLGVYRSTDEGNTWTKLPGISAANILMYKNGEIYAVYLTDVFRSSNNGDIWKKIPGKSDWVSMQRLAVNSKGHIFVATGAPAQYVRRTTDDGITWQQVRDNGLACYHLYISSKDYLFIDKSGEYYYSGDNGDTWSKTNYGGTVIFSTVSNTNGDIFFNPENGGVYMSKDNCQTYSAINNGLSEMNIRKLYIDHRNYLFAGSANGKLFMNTQSAITAVNENYLGRPSDFILEQNCPNPFNPSTIIGYQLPMDSFVNLRIIDVLGREIETLVNENQSAGFYKVTWQPKNISSGIYFCQLTAKNYSKIIKMVLLR